MSRHERVAIVGIGGIFPRSPDLGRFWANSNTAGENTWLNGKAGSHSLVSDPRTAALEAALGRAHLEIDFLRHSLEVVRKGGSRPPSNGR